MAWSSIGDMGYCETIIVPIISIFTTSATHQVVILSLERDNERFSDRNIFSTFLPDAWSHPFRRCMSLPYHPFAHQTACSRYCMEWSYHTNHIEPFFPQAWKWKKPLPFQIESANRPIGHNMHIGSDNVFGRAYERGEFQNHISNCLHRLTNQRNFMGSRTLSSLC